MHQDILRHGLVFIVIFIVFFAITFLFINKSVNPRKNPEIIEEANKRLIAEGKPAVTAEEFGKVHRKRRLLKSSVQGFASAMVATLVSWFFDFIS